MITEQDLQEAIAECQGVRNPTASTAIKLAAFLTIQRELYGNDEQDQFVNVNKMVPAYSYADEPPETYTHYSGAETVGDYGDSDFLQAVYGKDPAEVWPIMDELMSTLRLANERIYNSVMRRLA